MTTAIDCTFCIDGNRPAGTHDVMGEVFTQCPCRFTCSSCDGLAVFPAAFDCLPCFLLALAAVDMAPVFCPGCTGVIAVIDLDTEATT